MASSELGKVAGPLGIDQVAEEQRQQSHVSNLSRAFSCAIRCQLVNIGNAEAARPVGRNLAAQAPLKLTANSALHVV